MQSLSGENLIKPVYMPEKDIQSIRSLFSTYKLLTSQSVQIKNRIHSIRRQQLINIDKRILSYKTKRENYLKNLPFPVSRYFQAKLLLEQIKFKESQLTKIENEIKLLASKYYTEIDILTSMRGISVLSTIALIADIQRSPNAKHLSSYLRSTSTVDVSNDSIRIGKTNKHGRLLSISFLSQAITHFKDSNPSLTKWYQKKGKEKVILPKKELLAKCRLVLSIYLNE